ncbi:MAG TPA: YihY/virulence factor BrkB family protein [Ilumatobacteraceae bacterium]|jgi:membrane protein|nr:YihY/virulence factor BrkB family protein [Ilumatobacteraceae bacterium]
MAIRGAAAPFVQVVMVTYREWVEHRTIRLGAGLAYYGLFALVPVLAVSLSIASVFFARDDVQTYLADQLTQLLGEDADDVGAAVASLLDDVGSFVGLGLIGVASLFFAASVLVVALQDALNTIWESPVRTGVRQTVLRRLMAFAVVAAAGAVLVVSFALNAITALFARLVPDLRVVESLGELIGVAASWALGIGVIALLLRYLPETRAPWRSVLPGAAVTALLVAIGTVAIGAYLRRYASSSLVGATGSIFLVLLWIYYQAQIILAGAEFTRVLALRSSVGDDGQAGVGPREDASADVDR